MRKRPAVCWVATGERFPVTSSPASSQHSFPGAFDVATQTDVLTPGGVKAGKPHLASSCAPLTLGGTNGIARPDLLATGRTAARKAPGPLRMLNKASVERVCLAIGSRRSATAARCCSAAVYSGLGSPKSSSSFGSVRWNQEPGGNFAMRLAKEDCGSQSCPSLFSKVMTPLCVK